MSTQALSVRVGFALIGLVAVGCGGSAPAGTGSAARTAPLAVDIAISVQSPNFSPYYVADGLGLFSKAGLAPSPVNLPGGTTLLAAMASGQVGCAIIASDLAVQLRSKGADVKIVVGIEALPGETLLVPTGSPVTTIEQLKGKVIGVTGRGSTLELAVRYTLKQSGLDPDKDVTFVAVGTTPQNYIAAITNHQVGAVVSVEPTTTILVKQQKLARPLVNYPGGEGPKVLQKDYFAVLACTGSFIKNNRAATQRLVAAIVEADKFIQNPKNDTQSLAIVSKHVPGVPLEVLTAGLQQFRPGFQPAVTAENIAAAVEFSKFAGSIAAGASVSYADAVDVGLMPKHA